MGYLREWVLYPPADLVKRLEALAQQQFGKNADAKQWAVSLLNQVADKMELEIQKAESKKNLVQLVDAAGRPQISASLLVPKGG